MRISDWSSDVCSSDLLGRRSLSVLFHKERTGRCQPRPTVAFAAADGHSSLSCAGNSPPGDRSPFGDFGPDAFLPYRGRSEEHTSELQSLMRISYAVFCLKKKKQKHNSHTTK